jgi:hypothetical protein
VIIKVNEPGTFPISDSLMASAVDESLWVHGYGLIDGHSVRVDRKVVNNIISYRVVGSLMVYSCCELWYPIEYMDWR